VRFIKEVCLNRLIFFGENPLRQAIRELVAHYHRERNHQGLGNRLILSDLSSDTSGMVRRRERLDGLLNYYYRVAA
jgi:putative transposase